MKNIYEEAKKTLPKEYIDNHYSDLYLKVTKDSTKLVNDYDYKWMVKTFISNIKPHCLWYEIPFACPYYEEYKQELKKDIEFIKSLNGGK